MRQADIEQNGSDVRLNSAKKTELAQLRRDKRRPDLERDIIKRATTYFAWENILQN
jgi:transposase-like protein